MNRDPATFTVTQALERAEALNRTSFELAHMAREQRGSTAGNLIELSAQLIQKEYYDSLQHLYECLQRMYAQSPSSGVSAEIHPTTSESSSLSGTLSLSQLGTITPEVPLKSSES